MNKQTLQKIKNFRDSIIAKNGEPLAGIDLAGVGIEKLRELPKHGEIGLKKGVNYDGSWEEYLEEYKDWVQLSALGDGNCFLHSYAVHLIGRSDLELTLKLRVAMCLELMTNLETRYLKNRGAYPAETFKSYLYDGRIYKNGKWLSNFEIGLLGFIFKRKLIVISKYKGWFWPAWFYPEKEGITAEYPETWVIYNSGNHFQPLIPPPPNKTS